MDARSRDAPSAQHLLWVCIGLGLRVVVRSRRFQFLNRVKVKLQDCRGVLGLGFGVCPALNLNPRHLRFRMSDLEAQQATDAQSRQNVPIVYYSIVYCGMP